MGSRVSVDQLADAVMRELDNYADTTTDGVKAAVKKAADTVKKEISATATQKAGGQRPRQRTPTPWKSPSTPATGISWRICWNTAMPNGAADVWLPGRILPRLRSMA